MEMNMSRRNFVRGALLAGTAAAGMGMTACSPKSDQPKAAATDEAAQEQSNEIPRKEGKETKNCDVAIVGAGAAGLMAALVLARAGRSVIVCEKAPSAATSNFSMCGGPAACGTKLQASEGEDLPLNKLFDYMYNFSRTSVNGKLLRNSLAGTTYAIDSMCDFGVPMTLWPDVYGNGFRARHFFSNGGNDRVAPIVNAIEEAGGEFLYSAGGEKIIMENGKAVGVQTEAHIDVMAKAIVVATGGFCGDDEMSQKVFNTKVFNLGSSLCDGGGIRMVQDAGGALDRNFAVLGNECGAVSSGVEGTPFDAAFKNLNEHLGYWLFGGLYTDTAGERYINEYRIAQFPLAIGGEALVRTGKSYCIMDDDYYQACQNEGIFAYLGSPASWASGAQVGYYCPTKENAETHLQQAIDQGWAAKADTIAELAEKFNLPKLEETVESYNKYCEQGVDEEFGKDPAFLKPVAKAPFYIFEYLPSAWSTNGGIKVDSMLRAMDKDNNAIEGLYVAGVDQGSTYCVPYYDNPGSSVGIALGSGVYAGNVVDEYLG